MSILGVWIWSTVHAGPEATLPQFGRPEDVAAQNIINRQNYDLANKAATTRLQATTLLIGGTTATVTALRAEAGAVVLANNTGGAVQNVTGIVNFLTPFTTAPMVWSQHVGMNGTEAGYPPSENAPVNVGVKVFRVTPSSCVVQVIDTTGGLSIGAGQRHWVVWQAWGR